MWLTRTAAPAPLLLLLMSQATAIAFGSNHTAALLVDEADEECDGHHSLYTFGRGERTHCC